MTDRSTLVRLRAEVSDYIGNMRKAKKETQDLHSTVDKASGSTTGAARTHEASAKRMSNAAGAVKANYAKMGAAVGAVSVVVGAKVVQMANDAVDAYSALSEQISATKTLFGDAAAEMLRFGEGADAIGLSERAALQAGNAFGDLFLKIGYSSDAAATVSEDLVRMAADFASFKDLDPGDVLGKLKSGLSGESEPLRDLGVFLNETKVKAEGARLGLQDAHGEMTDGAKISARYSLIIKEMGQAYGDVSRTADSYANRQRRFAAETENLKASAGKALLPVFEDLQLVWSSAAGGLNTLSDAVDDNGGSFLNAVNPVHYLAEGIRKFQGDANDGAESADYLADSQKILANASKYTKEQVQAATRSIQEEQAAMDELVRATRAQFSSEIDFQRSVLRIGTTLQDYNKALAANKDKKRENNVSTSEIKDKQLDLRDALLSAGEAAVRQADDNAKAAGRTLTESEKYDVFRDALRKLREQFPQLRGDIDRYIARLGDVPETVTTKLTVTNVDTVVEGLKAVDYLMGTLDGKKATVSVIRSDDGTGLLTPGGLGDPPPVKKAAGGWVRGPGGPRDDLIPARLSAGEFVVRASAAARNGSTLERMNSGQRFADGGWVAGPRHVSGGGALSEDQVARLEKAVREARPVNLNATVRDLNPQEFLDEAVFAANVGRL